MNGIDTMSRWFPLLAVFFICGCSKWPSNAMYPPEGVPTNAEDVDPWIASILNGDVSNARRFVSERLKSTDIQLAPMVARMSDYTPCQVVFSEQIGHVRCVKQSVDPATNKTVYHSLYLVQPMGSELLQKRLEYFEESLRPTMSGFLERFAGSGEEVAGNAGHFSYIHWPTATEFGFSNRESLGGWSDAIVLYHCMNGDAVIIKPDGATAWRVSETDETLPFTPNIVEFVKIYAEFRESCEVFDSWAYREFKARK